MIDWFQVFEAEVLNGRESVYKAVFNWKIDIEFCKGICEFVFNIFQGMSGLEVVVVEEEVFDVIDNWSQFFFVKLDVVFQGVSSFYECINHFVSVHKFPF